MKEEDVQGGSPSGGEFDEEEPLIQEPSQRAPGRALTGAKALR